MVVRTHYVVRAIYVRRTYYLYMICRICRSLDNQSRHILEIVVTQDSLYKKYVIIAIQGLQYAKVIYISVIIEVKV